MIEPLSFPATLTPDDNGTLMVTFDDVPEVATFGATEVEALAHAREALELVLTSYVADKRPLPLPSPAEGRPLVHLGRGTTWKLKLYARLPRRALVAPLAFYLQTVDTAAFAIARESRSMSVQNVPRLPSMLIATLLIPVSLFMPADSPATTVVAVAVMSAYFAAYGYMGWFLHRRVRAHRAEPRPLSQQWSERR